MCAKEKNTKKKQENNIHFPGFSVIQKFESEIQLQEEKYHSFFYNNPLPQWIFDAETHIIVEVNKAAIETYGYSREEFIGKHLLDLRSPEYKDELTEVLKIPYNQRKELIKNRTWKHQKKDGSLIDAEIDSIGFESRGKTLVLVSIKDVTEKLKLQKRIEESERLFRLLAENAHDIVFRYSLVPEYKIEYISPSVKEITGYSQKEMYDKPSISYEMVHPDDVHKVWEINQKLQVKSDKPLEPVILRSIRKDGSIVWTETLNKGVYDEEGKLIGVEGISRDVTERIKNIDAIQKQNQDYRELLEKAPYGIIIHKTGKIVYMNALAHKLTGYDHIEDIPGGGSLLGLVDEVYKEDVIFRMKEVMQGRKVDYMEMRYQRPDGNILYVETKGITTRFDGEDAIQIVIRDITEQKKASEELKINQESFKSLVEFSPDGIIIHENGKLLYGNPSAKKILGYEDVPDEKIMNKDIFQFIEKKYHKIVKERMEKTHKGEPLGFMETEFVRPDGRTVTLETKSVPVIYNNRKATQIVIHDVSEKKQVEKEQLRAHLAEQTNKVLQKEIFERIKIQKQLLQAQTFTRALISSSIDIICASDNDGNIVEFNAAAQKAFGYTASEIIGKRAELLYANPEETSKVANYILSHLDGFKGEVINRRKNGEVFISYLSASALRNEKGEIIGSMGVSRDITEIKRKEEQIKIQAAKLKAIFESGTHYIWTIDKNFTITSYNTNFKVDLWKDFSYEVKRNKSNFIDFVGLTSQNIPFWKDKLKKTLAGDPQQFELLYKTKNKEKHWRDIFLYPILNENNEVIEISCMAHDVSEVKKAEIELKLKTAKLNAIFESGTHFLWTLDNKQTLTSYNKNYYNFILKTLGLKLEANKTTLKDTCREDPEREKVLREKYRLAFKGIPQYFELPMKDKQGTTIWREIFLHPVYTLSPEITEVSAISHDISEKKKIEEETKRQSAKLNAIIHSSSHMIYTINKKYELTSFNENYAKTLKHNYGYRPHIGFNYLSEGKMQTMNEKEFELTKRHHEYALKGNKSQYEVRLVNKRGEALWYETFLDPIILPNGKVEEVSYITHNITDKKLAEEQLRASLKEKEVLLQEVHHRVKNNLQVISSILNLQSSYLKDENTISMLLESQNRIKSMSFIHEILYQTKDFSNINFRDYIHNIAHNLIHSYRLDHKSVSLKFDVDNVALNLDISIPCGLIVNELLSNAMKYAFPDKRKGIITTSVKQKKDTITITVADNGIGFPKHIDFRNTESLGLQLIISLTEQLNGKIKLDKAAKGTKFLITFKPQKAN